MTRLAYLAVVAAFSCLTCAKLPDQQTLLLPFDSARDALKESAVIDDVLDDFKPSYDLTVTWASHHSKVEFGNDIPVSDVSSPPSFQFHLPSKTQPPNNTVYTLALTDPDAKSRDNPKWSEMCHWLVTNITYPTTLNEEISPSELVEYQPPGPPPKTGKHRYVFVLLTGDVKKASEVDKPADRQHWGYGKVRHGVRQWAEENNLTVVSANFFYAQNEKQ